MAACSPISIRSSPAAQVHRVHSTPSDDLRRRSSGNGAETSSPGLPSPSTFAPARAKVVLRGGSNAQQVPYGARAGFTTARTLHTLIAERGGLEEDTILETREQRPKSKGKLVRHRRQSRTLDESSMSPRLAAFAHAEVQIAVRQSPHGQSALSKSTTPLVQSASPGAARRPSISLSEFSFNGDAPPAAVTPIKLAAPAKKPRKRPEPKADADGKPVASKRSRKPKAKSESIILNSDEPEEALVAVSEATVPCAPVVEDSAVERPPLHEASRIRPDLSFADFTFYTRSDIAPITVAAESATVPNPKRKRAAATKRDDGEFAAKKSRGAKPKPKTAQVPLDDAAASTVLIELSANTILMPVDAPEKAAPRVRKPRAKQPAPPPADVDSNCDPTESLPQAVKARKPRVRQTAEHSIYFASAAPGPAVVVTAAQIPPKPATDITPEEEINIFSQVNTGLDRTLHETPFEDCLGTLDCATEAVEVEQQGEQERPELAPRRRRSWTPTHDRKLDLDVVPEVYTFGDPDIDGHDVLAHMPMAQLLHGFAYNGADAHSLSVVPQTGPGEAPTKRRKIDLDDSTRMPPPPARKRKTDTTKADKPAKKPKSPKKKPQTITALATAAYLPVVVPEIVQPSVSAYFDTVKPDSPALPVLEKPVDEEATEAAPKVKKPRKSRAKVPNADGSIANNAKVTKAKAKAKVKFKEDDFRPPLCTPGKANAAIRTQDFLFGTSSQLAAEESPTFIREMQLAIRHSEVRSPGGAGRRHDADGYGTQLVTQGPGADSPTAKSYRKVPTAPHGTDLSLVQAERELWCSGSRDYGGGMLEKERTYEAALLPEDNRYDEPVVMPEEVIAVSQASVKAAPFTLNTNRSGHTVEDTAITTEEAVLPQADLPDAVEVDIEHMPQGDPLPMDIVQHEASRQPAESVMIDLSYTSPVAEDSAIELPDQQDIGMTKPDLSLNGLDQEDDGWALLRSDNSLSSDALPDIPLAALIRPAVSVSHRAGSPSQRTALPAPPRAALRALDANVAMQATESVPKPTTLSIARSLSTATASLAEPTKKPRGRPRKDVPLSDTAVEPTKRPRGRPRKGAATSALPALPEAHPKPTTVPAFLASPPALQKSNSHPFTLSQPTDWQNIDDISDLESPATPSSRRRRRATSSPPTIRPLDFSPPLSPSLKAPAVAPPANLSNAALKPTDAEWLSQLPVLFPKITTLIKSTPPSTSLKHPTWHEKILLYDPIVLEDLTAYLNSKGVRISVRRPKAKVKGRKKGEGNEGDGGRDWEVVEEELKGWMVQKWCEEHSICCLWREGLRGGVKGNY